MRIASQNDAYGFNTLNQEKMTPYSFKPFMTVPQSVLTEVDKGTVTEIQTKQSVGSKKKNHRENSLKAYDYKQFHF